MQTIDCLHHLVHIGFDEVDQTEFTKAVKQRIESISDNAWDVLNFVDEPKYSEEEAEKLQIIELAETLSDFLAHQNFQSSPISSLIKDEHLKWPSEVIEYLYQKLDGKWQKLREKSQLELDWYNNVYKQEIWWEMPQEVKQDIDKSTTYYRHILSEEFLDILIEMIDHFKGKNIYNIPYTDDMTNTTATHQERRDELIAFARKLIWNERIIISWMNDGDIKKFPWIDWTKPEEVFKSIHKRIWCQLPEQEIWEKHHANASNFTWDVNTEITRLRFERYKEWFFTNLKKKWFLLQPDTTTHIVWWEYKDSCVPSYKKILELYWIPESNIQIDDSISLICESDIEKDIL